MTALASRPLTREDAVQFCRRNYGRLSGREIVEQLTERGFPISGHTVRRWANPEFEEQVRRTQRDRDRERRLYRRMQDLYGAGLSCRDIARILKLDYGIDVAEGTVRHAFEIGRPTAKMMREYTERPR